MGSHSHHAGDALRVDCAVITISDTRTEADDTSGARIRQLLIDAGHRVADYRIVRDEPDEIRAAVQTTSPHTRIVITNGGTGLAARDTTFEAIRAMLDKEITGFGEIFRMLSYEQVGSAAMLSRAVAGIAGTRAIFTLPGSTKAVELAMTKLILPQLGHIAALVSPPE